MSLVNYIQLYIGIGLILMLTLDLMHFSIRSKVEIEEHESMRYTNFERVYLILLWPLVALGVIIRSIFGKTPE